jgi:hypothetical protein
MDAGEDLMRGASGVPGLFGGFMPGDDGTRLRM